MSLQREGVYAGQGVTLLLIPRPETCSETNVVSIRALPDARSEEWAARTTRSRVGVPSLVENNNREFDEDHASKRKISRGSKVSKGGFQFLPFQ
jgi:hypothetical protein